MMVRLVNTRRILAVSLWIVGAGCVGFGWLNATEGLWVQLNLGLGGIAFGAVGVVLAVRTGVAMGWLFLGAQGLMGATLAVPELTVGILLVLWSAVLLLFPSGRLPSRRWLVAPIALVVSTASWLVSDVLTLVENAVLSWAIPTISIAAVLMASSVRIVNDYRKAVGETRQQLKWFVWVLMTGGLLLLSSALGVPALGDANQVAGIVLLVGSPLAVGFAVTRYRLYEVDRIISRTISYAIVVGILGALVAVAALLVGTLFENTVWVAGVTLGVAAVFNPLRKRVQKWVDRRFNRAKYDHERVAEQFTARLRDGFEVDGLVRGWVGVVSETMQPSGLGVWVRTETAESKPKAVIR